MTESVPNDYHDYFIKDGKHIGEYEQMYLKAKDPWRMDKLGRCLYHEAALILFKVYVPKRPLILDLGCGKGLWRHDSRIRYFSLSDQDRKRTLC